jgi:ubiquitin carboxyl-terminal hydrolase 4/11/15
MIKRKILEKVATFSTHSCFEEEYDADRSVADSADTDLVITTGSDADSSGDGKVVANSIDGEDELVDVVMKESPAKSPATIFNTRRPKFLAPGTFLDPSLQNMFAVGFFSVAKEMIPTGWNVVDEDKIYPNINTRAPQQPEALEDEARSEAHSSNGLPRSESGEDDEYSSNGVTTATRMVEESDEDEDAAPPPVSKVSS